MEQHKSLAVAGFTRKYRVTMLVYVERFADVHEAIAREKQLKGWNGAWKIKLIERANPDWNDLDPTAC
jgi:putative endonuclease